MMTQRLTQILLLIVPLAVSYALTGWMRQYAIRAGQLDRPNARSSHVQPTPRGGGVAFVATTLTAILVLLLRHELPLRLGAALLIGGALVALVGLIDDRRGLAARWRFLAHLAAIAAVLLLLRSWDASLLASMAPSMRVALLAAALVGGVWLINLTNFMDGIDGIAGTEAVTACVGAATCSVVAGAPEGMTLVPIALAAGAFGFLLWNWPPARIFMGDAGSGFLGFCFAALTFFAAQQVPPLFWCWVILLGVFVTDATVTIVRRRLRGERVTEAHRTHGYQHASRRWRGHRPVTLVVGAVNVAWLIPCAVLVASGRVAGPLGAVLAYAPLIGLALWARSGAPEHGPTATVAAPPS
jgi:Fuc2NAc and GlcNAc transferase